MINSNAESIYFVEEFNSLVHSLKGKIIALNPAVCRKLDKEVIDYQIYEDFYDMFEREKYARECDQRKLPWFNAFDNYLRTKLTDPLDKKINFVKLYGYSIITMIDSFIIFSRNILSVLDKEKPSKVCLVTASHPRVGFDSTLFTDKSDLTSYLLPIICEEKGIPYSVIMVNPENSKVNFIHLKLRRFPSRAFKAIGRVIKRAHIQIIYLLFYLKRKQLAKEGKLKKILILREDWLGNLYKNATKAGHQILYHTIHGPKKNLFFRKRKEEKVEDFCVDIKTSALWEEIGESCIREFHPCEWISRESGIDLSRILNPRFLYFLQKICPIISITAKKYEKILQKEKINYVATAYKIFLSEYGVMTIAKLLPQVFSIHVEHGGGEAEYHMQYFSEQPTDVYATPSIEEAVFYDKCFNENNQGKIEVIASRVWIGKYSGEAKKTARRFLKSAASRSLNKHREKVCYLPVAQGVQRLRCTYPLSWYFHLQCNLCRYFAELPQYDFIIKVLPTERWIAKSLLNFLKDLKAPNIFYKDGNLMTYLRQADRVITDFPSTPTYEARLMGLPLLSLYHDSIDVWDGAREAYGKTLVPFRATQEALGHIDKFLSSKPEEYIIPVEHNFLTPDLLEIIENLKINV